MTRIRWIATGLLLAWAGWWAYFAFIQVPPPLIAAVVVGVLFAVPYAGWRWRRGGVLLVLEGIALLTLLAGIRSNPPITTLFLVATLALPPLVSRVLLVADGWKRAATT